MKSLLRDVAAFHTACDVPVLYRPRVPSRERAMLRRTLIDEEVNKELLPAIGSGDIVAVADGLADAIYVIVGTALEYGIPLDRVWKEVQRANMSKLDPVTRKAIKREDGKVLKHPNFVPPDIAAVLDEVV
jgi:predicted HAD superfamily Cof-like phosphohydrolase